MLLKKNRLPLRAGLQLKNALPVWRGKFFNLFASQDYSQEPLLAIIVTKKTTPKATARHKIKRRLAEVLAPLVENMSHKKILIYANKEVLNPDDAQLKKEAASAFAKISKNQTNTK